MATKAKNVDKPNNAPAPRAKLEQHADNAGSDLDVPEDIVLESGDVGDQADSSLSRREQSENLVESRHPKSGSVSNKADPASEAGEAGRVDELAVRSVTIEAPATPAKKGRPKKDEAPGAPKKKKPKKKGLVSASPSLASNPSYYYDIQNFIVTDSRALESFGCVIPTPPPAAHVATQVGRKVQAPPPPPATTPVDDESSEKYSVTDIYTKPGLTKVSPNAVFCPDCGHRMKKHRITVDEFRDEIVEFRHCHSAE